MSLKICLLVALVGFTAAAEIQVKEAASHKVDDEEQSRVARQILAEFDDDSLGSQGSLHGYSDVQAGHTPQYANIQQFSGGFGVPHDSSNSRSAQLLRRDNDFGGGRVFVPNSVGFGQGAHYDLQQSGGPIGTYSGVPQSDSSQNVMVSYQSGVPNTIPIGQGAPAVSDYYSQSGGSAVSNMIPAERVASVQRGYISQSAGQPRPNYVSIHGVAPASIHYISGERFGQAVARSSWPIQSGGSAQSDPFSGQPGGQGGSSGISVQPAGPVQALPLLTQRALSAVDSESRQPSEEAAPGYILVQAASSGPTNSFSSRINGQADRRFTIIQLAGPAQANSFPSQSNGQSEARYILVEPAGSARDNSAPNQQRRSAIPSPIRPIYVVLGQQGGTVIPSQYISRINNVPTQQSAESDPVEIGRFPGFPVGTAFFDRALGVPRGEGSNSSSSPSSHVSSLKSMLLMKLSNILAAIGRRQLTS